MSTKIPSPLQIVEEAARKIGVEAPKTLWHATAPWGNVARDSSWVDHFRKGLEQSGFTPSQIEGAVRSSLFRSTQAKQFYWDQSAGHWNLLLRFRSPLTVAQAAASYLGNWTDFLEEPLEKAIHGLREADLLRLVTDPAVLLRCWCSHRELQTLCRARGLKSGGNSETLILRLLDADPTILSNIQQGDAVYEVTEKGRECLASWYGW